MTGLEVVVTPSCNYWDHCGDWLGEGAKSALSSLFLLRYKIVLSAEHHQTGQEEQHDNMKVSTSD